MTIGDRIKKRREDLGMSQEELASKCGYKSRSSINKIEKDGRELPSNKISLIAKALRTSPAYLMGWTDKEKENKISLTHNEETHIEKYRKLSDSNKKDVDDFMDFRLHKEQQDYNKKQYLKVARGKGEELVSDEDFDKMIENSTEVKGDDDLV